MTNKKYKKCKLFIIILVIFQLIIFFSLFAWAIVRNVNRTEFTIYKPVCENETIRTVYKLIKTDVSYINCDKTITYNGIFKSCWNKEDSDWVCDEDYCQFHYMDKYHMERTTVVIKAENYKEEITKDIFEELNISKEVCNLVEVDMIQTKFDDDFEVDGETIELRCKDTYCSYCSRESGECFYSDSGISKSELTKEWLDKNCIVNCKEPKIKDEVSGDVWIDIGGCYDYNYICMDDYIVEEEE